MSGFGAVDVVVKVRALILGQFRGRRLGVTVTSSENIGELVDVFSQNDWV